MRNKLSERRAIIIAMLMKLSFFFISYPWPFYGRMISYGEIVVNGTLGPHGYEIIEHGCKYEWCKYTPAVNPYLYCIALVLLVGTSAPLMHIG